MTRRYEAAADNNEEKNKYLFRPIIMGGDEINIVCNARAVPCIIEKYFETTLYYDFKKDNASKSDEVENELHYSVLVDVENLEASENQIEKWKQGKEELYSSNITITVYEIIETSL